MARRTATKSRPQDADKDTPLTNPIEWAVAAISALLLLALIAFLVYEVVTRDSKMAVFELSVAEVAEGASSYVAIVDVYNAGHATAAAVEIEGTLTTGEQTTVSHVVLDYAPAESSRRAALLFDSDPREGQLELRVTGYAEP